MHSTARLRAVRTGAAMPYGACPPPSHACALHHRHLECLPCLPGIPLSGPTPLSQRALSPAVPQENPPMPVKKRLVPLIALFAAGSALAQAPVKQDNQWRGAINAGASVASGNTDATSFNVSANAAKASQDDKLNFYLTTLYGTKKKDGDKQETANLFRAGAKYDRNLNENVFAFGSLDTEHDKLQELDLRAVTAGGVGYHLIKNDNTIFDVFSGLTYNHERFTNETRNSMEFLIGEESQHRITDTTSLNQRFALYPNLTDSGLRAQFDAGLATSITKKIELKLTLSNRFQSNPRPGIKKTDTLFLTSIGYRFGAD
jgi:putative salt-induced outer membrane protein YdiY